MGCRHFTGLDICPPASTAAVCYEQAGLDLFRLKAADGSFDLVLALGVIDHIENPRLCRVELARLLKPGGLELFTFPNLHGAKAKLLFTLSDRLKQFDAKGGSSTSCP